jgi:hypothetical protein
MPQDYKSIALAIIGRHTYRLSGLDEKGLGKALAPQLYSYLLAVCQVFDELKDRKERMWVGYYMIDATPDAALKIVAKYKEANGLMRAIYWSLNEYSAFWGSDKDGFNRCKRRIEDALSYKDSLKPYNPYGMRELQDYEIPIGGNKNIRFELPEEGANYIVYNRNDEIVDGLDQVGTKETIEAIFRIAEVWRSKGTGAYFEVGDISRAGGLDTSAHKTHEDGKAFDMRPLRNDGGISNKPFTWEEVPPYHRDWTKAFIRMVLQLYSGSIIYFNDPLIFDTDEFRGRVLKMGQKGTKEAHENHLHVILPGGERLTNLEGK